MANKSFIRGAAVLGAAGIMVQILGAFFRIPLTNIIGDEGMGYYQTAYPIYIFLLVFSTNGAPAAISKMVSERLAIGRPAEAKRVFRCSFVLMGVLGLIAASVFFFGAKPIVNALSNPGAYMCMIAIAPALLLVPIMAVFRGYFQGMQIMEPTAISQFSEQVVRVAVGLTAAYMLMGSGLETAAAGACVGTSVGPVFGILVLIVIYMKKRKEINGEIESSVSGADGASGAGPDSEEVRAIIGGSGTGAIIKRLAWISIPVTLGVSILPIMNVGDVLFVMRRLKEIGFSASEATGLYGQLSGMAGSVINIPQALALSIALSLVPSIAAAYSTGDRESLNSNIALGLRTSMIIGVPCGLGLLVLAKPIMLLLFPTQAASVGTSGGCLALLAVGVIFLSASLSTAGMLQGINAPGAAVVNLVIAFIVKLIATWVLTGIPALNVLGAALASTIAYAVIGILNVLSVKKRTGFTFDLKLTIVIPLAAGIIMSLFAGGVYKLLLGITGNAIATCLGIAAGGITYLVFFFKLGGVTVDELDTMPMGGKLKKVLSMMRLI